MRDDQDNPAERDDADESRGDPRRGFGAEEQGDDSRGAPERRFKRRIDCSPRSDSPTWSDDRFR